MLKKMKKILEAVEPILYDLKDGTLRRTAPSKFMQRKARLGFEGIEELQSMDIDDSSRSLNTSYEADNGGEEDPQVRSKQQREVNKVIDSYRKQKTESPGQDDH